MALGATQRRMKMFVVPTLVGLFKNPPKGGTPNRATQPAQSFSHTL
jgi:hypothetical protein